MTNAANTIKTSKTSKTVHVISHTHWDREWYMPYEKHHVRLVRLMDTLLDLLETDPEFRSFHLDGQTIVLDDYLQVRPDQRDKVLRFVAEGRLIVGPWYVLQDEFLTSGEANVRNLLLGRLDALRYGGLANIGYFPDSFGNMGQAPQLLKQAGIDTAVFGRGVKPTGFNNSVSDAQSYESPFSEMVWRSPDGSEVLGILFANWYHNGMEIPTDPEQAKPYWEERMANAERYASTPHLLMMNGCDHQPVQQDLTAALATARRLFPDVEFVHSSFPEYAGALHGTAARPLTVVEGELRSQRTDGWGTLVNTASARVYLKQANQQVQTLLEKVTEPLAAFASLYGAAYPRDLLAYAWKTLMQNHPHDSICGCSVDEVHQEMMTRFAKSRHVAEALAEESAAALAAAADTSAFAAYDGARPFIVFNTTGTRRSGVVEVEVELARFPQSWSGDDEQRTQLAALSAAGRVVDASGKTVPCRIEDRGVRFGYELPDDRFRQPYWARVAAITLFAADVPALGCEAFAFVPGDDKAEEEHSLFAGERAMENDHLRVEFADNGTFALLDKQTGKRFADLGSFEDVGDLGNEYMFKQPDGEMPLTTTSWKASFRVVHDDSFRATLEIKQVWDIPASADATLEKERQAMVHFPERKAQRAAETVTMTIRTLVTLEKDARLVKLRVELDNQAEDHRLRIRFPTDIDADLHYADSIYEIAERPNEPAPEWTNPSYCHHQQAFAGVDDDRAGLMAANMGLNEYEVLRDGRNTIAVTLLRAVGELGDWGVFPTPEAQCKGKHAMELALIPYGGKPERASAANAAYQFQVPWTARRTEIRRGVFPARHAMLEWSGEGLALTAVKRSETSDDLIVRWFNTGDRETALSASGHFPNQVWYESNVIEEKGGELALAGAEPRFERKVRPSEIVTLGCMVPQHSAKDSL